MTLLDDAGNETAVAALMVTIVFTISVYGPALAAIEGVFLAANKADIVIVLAFTQKNTLTAMLQTGVRYFEFRPAHISSIYPDSSSLGDKLYFTHLVIPGQAFDSWLAEAVNSLVQNPTEFIAVQIRFDGIDSTCAIATDDEVDTYVSNALDGTDLIRSGFSDMGSPIDTLRQNNKRLIVLTHAKQYSSWGGDNSTLNGGPIVWGFQTFLTGASSDEAGTELAVWQCQATSTAIKEVAVYDVTNANSATSSLLCTKSICDTATLPWLQQNVFPKMPTTVLQAIMNDFFDGATSETAIQLSHLYLNQG